MLGIVAKAVPFIGILEDAVKSFGIERVLDVLAMVCEGRSEEPGNDPEDGAYWVEMAARISSIAHPHWPWP
jgi:hypothetical protein